MISQVRFENFKALQDVVIDLERLTVLVGANATGKTSVLEGLDLLTRLATHQHLEDTKVHGRFARVLAGRHAPGRLRTLGAAGEVAVSITGEVAAAFRVEPGALEDAAATHYTIVSGEQVGTSPRLSSPPFHEVFKRLEATGIGKAVRLRLDPSRLGAASYVDNEHPHVEPDGHGLASVLALARGEQADVIARIESDLRRIVPRARKVHTSFARIQRNVVEVVTINGKSIEQEVERTYTGQRFSLEIDGVGSVPADMLSEGTLLVLGLLTVLHTTPGLRLLLLDDLDRGLHPNAQRDVVHSLRAVLAENPQLQIVCSTHSPYALDGFEPSEVRVLQLDAHGKAGCKALTDHPDWPRWKDFMNPGEFWSSVGEDWIFGERDGSA